MSFYIRKAFRVGSLLRLNLSKSGIGASLGVRGFRLGSGPRGPYVHAGRYGLYYRKFFNAATGHGAGSRTGNLAYTEDDVTDRLCEMNPRLRENFGGYYRYLFGKKPLSDLDDHEIRRLLTFRPGPATKTVISLSGLSTRTFVVLCVLTAMCPIAEALPTWLVAVLGLTTIAVCYRFIPADMKK